MGALCFVCFFSNRRTVSGYRERRRWETGRGAPEGKEAENGEARNHVHPVLIFQKNKGAAFFEGEL